MIVAKRVTSDNSNLPAAGSRGDNSQKKASSSSANRMPSHKDTSLPEAPTLEREIGWIPCTPKLPSNKESLPSDWIVPVMITIQRSTLLSDVRWILFAWNDDYHPIPFVSLMKQNENVFTLDAVSNTNQSRSDPRVYIGVKPSYFSSPAVSYKSWNYFCCLGKCVLSFTQIWYRRELHDSLPSVLLKAKNAALNKSRSETNKEQNVVTQL